MAKKIKVEVGYSHQEPRFPLVLYDSSDPNERLPVGSGCWLLGATAYDVQDGSPTGEFSCGKRKMPTDRGIETVLEFKSLRGLAAYVQRETGHEVDSFVLTPLARNAARNMKIDIEAALKKPR